MNPFVFGSMFGLLCLIKSLFIVQSAIWDTENGHIKLTEPSDVPLNLKGVIDFVNGRTLITPPPSSVVLQISRQYDKFNVDPSSKSISFSLVLDKCMYKNYGTSIISSLVKTDSLFFGLNMKYTNTSFYQFNDFAFMFDREYTLFTLNDKSLYMVNKTAKSLLLPDTFNTPGLSLCKNDYDDLLLCPLLFTQTEQCPIKILLHQQHHIVLFTPIKGQGNGPTWRPNYDDNPKTTTPPMSTVTEMLDNGLTDGVTVSSDSEVEESKASFPIYWFIVLLIVECIVFAALGAGAVYIYHRKFKKPPAPISTRNSEEEENRTTIIEESNIQPVKSVTQKPVSKGNEVSVEIQQNPITALPKTKSLATGIPCNDQNISTMPRPIVDFRNSAKVTPYNDQGYSRHSHMKTAIVNGGVSHQSIGKPINTKKSKKSFLQRAKDKFRFKNKSASTPQQPKPSGQTSVDSNLNGGTLNIPIGAEMRREYKQKQKARKQVIEELEKKKLEQPTTTQNTFVNDDGVRVYGVDAEGCEQTQCSDEESYLAQLRDADQAKKDAEMYDRMYTPDGRQRTPAELAEYDAAKAAEKPG